jgi:glucokinase
MKTIGVGVDIGGSHIVSCGVDMATGKPIPDTQAEEKVNNKGTVNEVFTTWAKAINYTLSRVDIEQVAGVGFAMPGAFNYKTGIALFEGENDKYECLYGINVGQELKSYLLKSDLPLRFLNDASAFAVGTAWYGKARGTNRSIAVTLGTGFGSALIDSDLPVVDRADAPLHGCFWHLPHKEGIADDYFSTRWFLNAYKNLTGLQAEGVKEVAVAAVDSPAVQQIFEQFGQNLAQFLTPWLQKFQPEVLVIGGNISKAFDLFYPAMDRSLSDAGITLRVEVSALMEEAALIGSARLLDENFWNKIKDDLPEI